MDVSSSTIFSYLLNILKYSKAPIQDGYEAVLEPYVKYFKGVVHPKKLTHIVRYAVMYYRYNNSLIASDITLAELNAQRDRALS